MTELRFDGRVAIVTGAGGQEPSLGRSHAELLAERGAKVVVNDLGVGPDSRNVLRANAEQVVDQICGAGGEAVGGNVGIRVFGQTAGHYDSALTIEKVRDNFAAIVDTTTARLMPDLPDSGELAPGEAISGQIEVLPKRYQPS